MLCTQLSAGSLRAKPSGIEWVKGDDPLPNGTILSQMERSSPISKRVSIIRVSMSWGDDTPQQMENNFLEKERIPGTCDDVRRRWTFLSHTCRITSSPVPALKCMAGGTHSISILPSIHFLAGPRQSKHASRGDLPRSKKKNKIGYLYANVGSGTKAESSLKKRRKGIYRIDRIPSNDSGESELWGSCPAWFTSGL